MKKFLSITCISCLFSAVLHAQEAKPTAEKTTSVFESMALSATDFQRDTTPLPNDSITSIILELRNLRGNFNINEVITLKIEAARQKNEIAQIAADSRLAFLRIEPIAPQL